MDYFHPENVKRVVLGIRSYRKSVDLEHFFFLAKAHTCSGKRGVPYYDYCQMIAPIAG